MRALSFVLDIVILLAILLALEPARAADTIVGNNQTGERYLVDNSGNRWKLGVAYTTNGSGDIYTLGGNLASSDSTVGSNQTGVHYLIDNSSNRWELKVFYTTDGSGNVIPISAGGSGTITSLTGEVIASGSGAVAATVVSITGSSAANVHAAELLANAATSANTASAIVKRGASGEIAVGAITPAGAIIPSVTNTVDLGDSSHFYRNVYVNGFIDARGEIRNSSIVADGNGTNGNIFSSAGGRLMAIDLSGLSAAIQVFLDFIGTHNNAHYQVPDCVTTPCQFALVDGSSLLLGPASSATNALAVLKDGHLKSTQTTAPVATVDAHAGTGATCALTHATDMAGIITLTTTAVSPAGGTECSIAFNKAYNVAPICTIGYVNANAAILQVSSGVFWTSTTGTLVANFNTTDAIGHAYVWNYNCVETQ